MTDYLFLMHDDAPKSEGAASDDAWGTYIQRLKAAGCFQGGSSIGPGLCLNLTRAPAAITSHLVGYMRVSAHDLNHARELVKGNPVLEAGGTVEIRELPKS